MGDYCKVFSRIWNDPDFTALNGDCQRLYLMLLSYPTRDNAGVLPLTLRRWATATNGMSPDSLTAALERLAEHRFVVVDWNTEEVLIRSLAKNDETYKQCNVWINALNSARKVQSPLLRWVLADEFGRLPEHKESAKTLDTVNSLLEGLPKGFAEGLPKGFAEGFAEPPGVGALRSNRLHQAPAPAPTPAPVRARDPEAHGRAATPAADLVRAIVGTGHPAATLTALRIQTAELLHQGTAQDLVETALRLWCDKPAVGNGRNILASLCSEVIKSRASPGPSGKPHKMRTLAQLAQETAAEENRKELPA